MRLLFVTQDFPPATGGIQTYSLELARALAARADAFTLVAPAHAGAAAFDAGLPFAVRRVRVRLDALPLALPFVLPRLVRETGADAAFHAQWQTTGAALRLRRRGALGLVAAAAHGRELLQHPAVLARAFPRALARADHFFPVSDYTAGLLRARGVPDERITAVPNGIDTAAFSPEDAAPMRERLGISGALVLLTVCRLVPRKGVDAVLDAFARVAPDFPNAVYLIAGEGPERARLETRAAALELAGRVRFLGRVPDADLRALYNASDVFALAPRDAPPDVEGFGLVFLEAGACARPVVATRAGGVPDAVRDGETGLLVPPGDVEALADALSRLLGDEALRARMGEAGRAHALTSSWEAAGARVFAALERATLERSAP